jgi:hypothetical protein
LKRGGGPGEGKNFFSREKKFFPSPGSQILLKIVADFDGFAGVGGFDGGDSSCAFGFSQRTCLPVVEDKRICVNSLNKPFFSIKLADGIILLGESGISDINNFSGSLCTLFDNRNLRSLFQKHLQFLCRCFFSNRCVSRQDNGDFTCESKNGTAQQSKYQNLFYFQQEAILFIHADKEIVTGIFHIGFKKVEVRFGHMTVQHTERGKTVMLQTDFSETYSRSLKQTAALTEIIIISTVGVIHVKISKSHFGTGLGNRRVFPERIIRTVENSGGRRINHIEFRIAGREDLGFCRAEQLFIDGIGSPLVTVNVNIKYSRPSR